MTREPKPPAYGKKAKRRRKAQEMAGMYALQGDKETADYWWDIAERIEGQLRGAGVCIRCGRPLKNQDSLELGLGPECQDKQKEASQ